MNAAHGYGSSRNWKAELSLGYRERFGKTSLVDMAFKGPLRVQRSFYPEDHVCHTYLLHPPGGMVSGDKLNIDISIGSGSHTLLTTPSAGKVYGADSANVAQSQMIRGEVVDGVLEWLPQETILFDRANAQLTTRFDLDESSILGAWEMVGFGRQAGNLPFTCGQLTQSFEIYRSGRCLLNERFKLDEALRLLDSPVGLMGKPYYGNFYWAGEGFEQKSEELKGLLASIRHDRVLAAVTSKPDLVVIRALSEDAEALRDFFMAMWEVSRPLFVGRPACRPRIWST